MVPGDLSAGAWAQAEFGAARLGDERRTRRLAQIAGTVVRARDGSIAGTFKESAEREAAYRFVENEGIEFEDIVSAAAQAGIRRAAASGCAYVVVPVDGSTLTVPSATEDGDYGPVGTAGTKALGLESMNAVLVSPVGVVIGVAGQTFWARKQTSKRKKKPHAGKRPIAETENAHWLVVMEQALEAQRAVGPEAPRLWFQLDRGGDARDIIFWASQQDAWVTIRAAQDRRVEVPDEGLLWDTLAAQPVAGTYEVDVLASPTRKARRATIEVKFTPVLLPLRSGWTKSETWPTPMYAVNAKEVSDTKGDEPIEWMLLTNHEVTDLATARLVIDGYTKRWKVEEVHRTWKTTCKVERAALHDAAHLMRWAAILFAVATRIERLKMLARGADGARPATEELTALELEALVLLRAPRVAKGATHTIAQAVRWLADLGGYTGPSSGPPGAVTLARGLQTLAPAVELLRRMRTPEGEM